MTTISNILRALRLGQWAKNLLLFVPLVMAHRWDERDLVLKALLAFVCFGLFASAGYILNDLLDVEADRLHPAKARRPFASGALGPATGAAVIAVAVVAGAAGAYLLLPRTFTWMLAGYLALSVAYSVHLKKILLVDVILLAGLYTYRVLAGSAAVDVPVTTWLLAFSMFVFLSLAFAKRYNELMLLQSRDARDAQRRAYRVDEMDLLLSVGPTLGCISVLVLALYIADSRQVDELYPSKTLLWFICPILLYWILRMWFLARRGELPADPVTFAMTDPASIVAGALTMATIMLARFFTAP